MKKCLGISARYMSWFSRPNNIIVIMLLGNFYYKFYYPGKFITEVIATMTSLHISSTFIIET